MTERHDLAIIGAGPAGLAAAATAADLGLKPLLIDEQTGPGGQIYRNVENSPLADATILGPDYKKGEALARCAFLKSITYLSAATVWQVNEEREIGLLRDGRAQVIGAKRIILATGAQERPFPIPGWTLPGVMAAGAGQILLKSGGLVPEGAVVLAGCGPLLWLIAAQYLDAGVTLAAILETAGGSNRWSALKHLPAALTQPSYLTKGLALISKVRRAGIAIVSNVTALRAKGSGKLSSVAYERVGQWQDLPCDHLLLHHGVVPNLQMTRALGCAHTWHEGQLCWRPETDAWGTTDLEGIAVAGDGAGIVGAIAAEHSGRLAALEAAVHLGLLSKEDRDSRAKPIRRDFDRQLRVRAFLDQLYRPAAAFRRPPDETLVCRCEEVTAGEVRRVAALGCQGPNQLKAFTRCGMGPCQGRLCGTTVAELIAEVSGHPLSQIGAYRIRPPIKPITLGEVADMDLTPL